MQWQIRISLQFLFDLHRFGERTLPVTDQAGTLLKPEVLKSASGEGALINHIHIGRNGDPQGLAGIKRSFAQTGDM